MIKSKFRSFLAFYIITLSFGFIFLITLYEPAQGVETSNTILGFLLGTGLAAVIAFYFGSTDTPIIPEPEPKKPENNIEKINDVPL